MCSPNGLQVLHDTAGAGLRLETRRGIQDLLDGFAGTHGVLGDTDDLQCALHLGQLVTMVGKKGGERCGVRYVSLLTRNGEAWRAV